MFTNCAKKKHKQTAKHCPNPPTGRTFNYETNEYWPQNTNTEIVELLSETIIHYFLLAYSLLLLLLGRALLRSVINMQRTAQYAVRTTLASIRMVAQTLKCVRPSIAPVRSVVVLFSSAKSRGAAKSCWTKTRHYQVHIEMISIQVRVRIGSAICLGCIDFSSHTASAFRSNVRVWLGWLMIETQGREKWCVCEM